MKIIDMRCRPAYLHPFFGAVTDSPEYETAKWLNKRVGARGVLDHFARSQTRDGFLAEVREAGLTHAVVVGRRTPAQTISNDFLGEITQGLSELIGIAGADPLLDGVDHTITEINRAIDSLKLRAVNIEPGFASPPTHPDDQRYFAVYEHLQARNIPLSLMTGPTTPNPEFNNPDHLVKVAQNFPALKIIVYHGYFPNCAPLAGAAFRYENIFVVPDMYGFIAGGEVLIEAAKSYLQEQFLFGSSYPFRPIKQSIDDFKAFGFSDTTLEKLLYRNAARVLGIL